MSSQYPGRPSHPDFWVLSQIIIDQDNRATSQADSFENLIAEVVDVPSLAYMASQRAMRTRSFAGPAQVKLTSLWIDAFMAGAAYQRAKDKK